MTQLDAITTVEALLALATKLEATAAIHPDGERFTAVARDLREVALRQADRISTQWE